MHIKSSSLFIFVIICKYVSCYLRVCYYTNWSQYRPGGAQFTPDKVDPTLCSHIIFAFAKLEGNQLAPFEYNDESSGGTVGMYDQINNMKKRNPQLKTLLAVGGWNAGSLPFSDMVATQATRQTFINSTLVYLRSRNFNGLDLDWEYPTSRGGRPADKQNLVALLSELRRAFEQESYHTGKERLLLTCAVPAGKSNIDAGYDVPNIARSLDFINIMTYDMHGSWESVTGHNSPLYGRAGEGPESALLNMDWAAKYWLRNGAPKHRLIMGFGLYGRSFKLRNPAINGMGADTIGAGRPANYTKEAGFMAYYEVCDELRTGAVRAWDAEHKCPYLYKDDLWVGYDDAESIREKIQWLKAGGYGGVMVWSLALDDFDGRFCNSGHYPLLTAINNELREPPPVKLPPVAMPPVVVSDRLHNVGHSRGLTLPSGLSFRNHQSPPLNSMPPEQPILTFEQNPFINNSVPTPPQPLPPSSEVAAGQTRSALIDIPVIFNVPPTVAQIVPAPAIQNIPPPAAPVPDVSSLTLDTLANQVVQPSNIDLGVIQSNVLGNHNQMQQQGIAADVHTLHSANNIDMLQPVTTGTVNGISSGAVLDVVNQAPHNQPQAETFTNANSLHSSAINSGMPLFIDGVPSNNAAVNMNTPVSSPGAVLDVVNQAPHNQHQAATFTNANSLHSSAMNSGMPLFIDGVPSKIAAVNMNTPVGSPVNPGVVRAAPPSAVATVPQRPGAADLRIVSVVAPAAAVVQPAKPKVNFSFSSSSSSSSNSSSSSSNSSSRSSVNLKPVLSLTQLIQQALQERPSDRVIIADLPSTRGVSLSVPLGTPAPATSIITVPPVVQFGSGSGGSVIPITSVSNLEELLATLNTNLPTSGAVLLPQPNNDLTPTRAMQELSLENVLHGFGLGTQTATQPRSQPVQIRRVAARLPASPSVVLQPRRQVMTRVSPQGAGTTTRGRGVQNNRALIEAIRRDPTLRARIIASRRRAAAGSFRPTAAGSVRPTSRITTSRAQFRPIARAREFPVQIRSQSPRAQSSLVRQSQTVPVSGLSRQRSLSREPVQRTSASFPVSRRTISPRVLRTLSPAQLNTLRARLRARSRIAAARTQPQAIRRTGFQTSRSAPQVSVRQARTSLPRRTISQIPGIMF